MHLLEGRAGGRPRDDARPRPALGRLEYVAPKESFEPLAVDDEEDEPFILRCRNGKGQVLLMNWWGYPAAANMDVGCGAEIADVGMVGYLYRYAAKLGRGGASDDGLGAGGAREKWTTAICGEAVEAVFALPG